MKIKKYNNKSNFFTRELAYHKDRAIIEMWTRICMPPLYNEHATQIVSCYGHNSFHLMISNNGTSEDDI